MKYYKFIAENNRGYNEFDYTDYLPRDGQPGKPLPTVEGEIEPCENGYHACKPQFVSHWIDSPQLYEVELSGTVVDGDDKTAASDMRFIRRVDKWDAKTQRLFAVWCARESLKLVDNLDPRSVAACDVAERYANGTATDEELAAASAAARYAASAAAWAAAWYAARDAARDAQSAKLLEMCGEA